MNFYVGCLIIFLLVLLVTIVTTRRKAKVVLEEIKEQEAIIDEITTDKFDLYESIYDFMTKQNQYIRSLG